MYNYLQVFTKTSRMVYTIRERSDMMIIYGSENRCARRTARAFNDKYPGKNVSHRYVIDLVQKFLDTGSVCNQKIQQPRVLDEGSQVEIIGHFAMDPNTSVRKVARKTNISTGSVHKALKLNKFFPYKIQMFQQLCEDDCDRRIQFCEEMSQKITEDPNLLKNICFSDESTFFLNGFVNKHNCRYWDNTNPFVFREDHTQFPEKVNVWAGILGDEIIGPVFIEGNLTGQLYLQCLEDVIDPLITQSVETQVDGDGNMMLNEEKLHFQQDGAPPHYAVPVREWLNERFPRRWIGRRGIQEWPARSPDLTPLDFFLWGYLKTEVYKTPVHDLPELRARISRECRNITRETFEKVRREFENRLYYCLANNGSHFEHVTY